MQTRSRRPLAALFCALTLAPLAPAQAVPPPPATARTITVRLINGKTGKPLANKDVNVGFYWDDPTRPADRRRVPLDYPHSSPRINLSLDKNGTGQVTVPPRATFVHVVAGFQQGRVDAKVIRYTLCNRTSDQFVYQDRFGVKTLLVPIDAVLAHGFVPETACTPKEKPQAAPGEYVLLAVPYSCGLMCGLDVP